MSGFGNQQATTVLEEQAASIEEVHGEDYAMKLVLINGLRRNVKLCDSGKLKQLFLKHHFIYKSTDSKRSLLKKLKADIKTVKLEEIYEILQYPDEYYKQRLSVGNGSGNAVSASSTQSTTTANEQSLANSPPRTRPAPMLITDVPADSATIEESIMNVSAASDSLARMLGLPSTQRDQSTAREPIVSLHPVATGGESIYDPILSQLNGIAGQLRTLVGEQEVSQRKATNATDTSEILAGVVQDEIIVNISESIEDSKESSSQSPPEARGSAGSM